MRLAIPARDRTSMEHIWTQPYLVNSFLADPQKRLGLSALLNLLQDTAWVHATHLGHGYESSMEKQMAWVLTRQKIVMESWPAWGEPVHIRSWVRSVTPPFASRDFEVLGNGGRVVGQATTSWLMMDLETRRPMKRSLSHQDLEPRKDYQVPFETSKIELVADLQTVAHLPVRYSDLDVNQHVNNTKYAQWIQDSLSLEWHQAHVVSGYEINFLAETRAGDEIALRANPERTYFQGWREADQKVVFAARLTYK